MSQIAGQRYPHIWIHELPIWKALEANRLKFDTELLKNVRYANGDIFVSNEDKEEVMVDTVTVKDHALFIKLVSLDKTFQSDPIEYLVSEQMLFKYYTRTGKVHPFIGEGNYSVTVGD